MQARLEREWQQKESALALFGFESRNNVRGLQPMQVNGELGSACVLQALKVLQGLHISEVAVCKAVKEMLGAASLPAQATLFPDSPVLPLLALRRTESR